MKSKQPIDYEVLKKFKSTYPIKITMGHGYFKAPKEDAYLINNHFFWLKESDFVEIDSEGIPRNKPTP